MRRFAFVFAFIFMVGCDSDESSPPASAMPDAGVDMPTATTFTGEVRRDLCRPLERGTVSIVGAEEEVALEADGRFFLEPAPEEFALKFEAEGFVPSLSVVGDAERDHPFLAIREEFVDLVHRAAGGPWDESRGALGLAFAQPDNLPVDGVSVEIESLDEPGASIGEILYVGFTDTDPAFPIVDGSLNETAPGVGSIFVGDARPGRYRATATREGYEFAPVEFTIDAGAVTVDIVRGSGDGSALPVDFEGVVQAPPAFPETGPIAPLADAAITVTYGEDDATVTAVSDEDGRYAVRIDRLGVWADVTVDAPEHGVFRGERRCMTPAITNVFDMNISDRIGAWGQLLPAFGPDLPDPQAGHVVLIFHDGAAGVETRIYGATVELEGSDRPAYYGRPGSGADCEVGTCTTASDCPSEARCEADACLLGTAPTCQPCDPQGACGEGYSARSIEGACRCLAERQDCLDLTEGCAPGMFCRMELSTVSGMRQVDANLCRPLGEVLTDAGSGFAIFVNVTPGEYVLRAAHPDHQFETIPVRVSPEVITAATVPTLRIPRP